MKIIFQQAVGMLLLCAFILPVAAQESAMEQFLSAHSMSMLTADSVDPNHHDLVITALAMQQLTMTDQPAHPAAPHPESSAQPAPQPCVLQIDTLSGRAELLSMNGQHLADVHFTLVDSTWYMWLSVDPLADKNIQNSPYMYCSGNPIIRIDPDGCFDKEETLDGLKHMGQGGLDGTIAFAAWVSVPETAGASALVAVPMTIEGYSEFQIGFGRFLDGLFSDPQEGKMERIQQLPTSILNAIAKGIDQSMGNKNREVETIVDGLKIISGNRLKLRDAPNVVQEIIRVKTFIDVDKWINSIVERYGTSQSESNPLIDNNPTNKETNLDQLIK